MPKLSKQYFAARERKDIGKAIVEKLEQQCRDEAATMREEYANAYDHLYGDDAGGMGLTSGVTRGGEQNEKAIIRTNRAGAYGNAFEAIAMGPKLSWKPQARNGDAGAARATSLSENLLESEWKTKGLSAYARKWGSQALRFSEAWMFSEWDLSKGPPVGITVDPYSGQSRPVLGGEITYHNLLPWHVFRDISAKSHESNRWRTVRVQKNRWDTISLFPRLVTGDWSADAILGAAPRMALSGTGDASEDSDFVWVYFFFHDKTPALPNGRQVVLIGPECVLADSALKYPEVPTYRIAAAEKWDTPFAWSPWWDTLGIQELTDAAESDIATNISTFGSQLVSRTKGSEITASKVAGLRFLDVPVGGMVPQGVNLTKNDPSTFNWLKDKAADQRQLMGLNDVALGQPQTAQMNAEAFAILASMATQQASPFQSAWIEGLASLGRGVLKMTSKFVNRKRTLQIVGKSSESLFTSDEYEGKEVEPVEQVIIDIGNALEQTAAGRMTLLEKYMALPGVITSPEQIQQVAETGRLEPVTRGRRNELLLINAEYEQLTQGKAPLAHYAQNHPLHFRENATALYDPAVLADEARRLVIEQHLDEHYLYQFGVSRIGDPAQGIPGDPMRFTRERWMMGQPLSPDQAAMAAAPPIPMGPPGAGPGGPPGPGAPPEPEMAPPGMGPPPEPGQSQAPIQPPPGLVAA